MLPIPDIFRRLVAPWPHAARAVSLAHRRRLLALLRDVGLAGDPRAEALVKHMVRVEAAVFPASDDADAALAALVYGLWVYLLDDALDEGALAGDLDRTRARLDRAFLAVSGAPEGVDPIDRVGAALHGLLAGDPVWMESFLADVHAYLYDGALAAASARAAGHAPSLDAYLDARMHDGAILPAARLLERLLGLRPGPTWDARTAELRRLAARHVALANDLFSYDKESRRGSRWNLVAVLRAEGRTLEGAARAAVAILNADALRFRELCEAGACDADSTDDEAALAEGLGRFIAGNLAFSLASARYRAPGSVFAELRPAEARTRFARAS